jgi:hypothetical protein
MKKGNEALPEQLLKTDVKEFLDTYTENIIDQGVQMLDFIVEVEGASN